MYRVILQAVIFVVADGFFLLMVVAIVSDRVFHKLSTIQECQYRQLWFGCTIQI